MNQIFRTHPLRFLLALLLLLGISSCKKDETSGIPSYVKINEIAVQTDYRKEGSTSSNLSDAWFYAEGDHLGVYEIPTEIPVLESGITNLTVFGGIKISGISSLRQAYPFYDLYEMDTLLVEEETVTIRPILKYKTNTTFSWLEDFDDFTISLETSEESRVPISRIYDGGAGSDSVYEGKGSMGAFMSDTNNYFMCNSTSRYSPPKNGDHVYLEFDYKCDRRIQLLLRTFSNTSASLLIPVMVVRPKLDENGDPTWNKMYAYLTPFISSNIDAYEFEFYFESWATAEEESSYMMLDNIKLVH